MASSLALCAHVAFQLVSYLSEMHINGQDRKPHLAPGPDGCDWELTAVTQGRAVAQEHTVTLYTLHPVLFNYCTQPWAQLPPSVYFRTPQGIMGSHMNESKSETVLLPGMREILE